MYGVVPTRYAHLGAETVANSDYAALKTIPWDIHGPDVLVDVGCGKGRVINWWLKCGFRNKIVGLEIDEEIAERTRRRLRRFANVTILTGNALENLPRDGTLFFLFNPFAREVVDRFRACLEELSRGRQGVRIIYLNPRFLDIFVDDPSWSVERIERFGGGSCHNDWAIIKRLGP